MATSTQILLSPQTAGVFHTSGLSPASAQAVSEVLQHDMENHHIYLNNIEFHNHIVHFMLTVWALGASPETIRAQYHREHIRQRQAMQSQPEKVQAFKNKQVMLEHMYREENYASFLVFFQGEIGERGINAVLNEYLFQGDELAESLLSRMFSGLVHPIIHLGFGIEFDQPAIVAQALAQASVHQDYLGRAFFSPAAKKAATSQAPTGSDSTLVDIMESMGADDTIRNGAKYGDTDVFTEGLLKRVPNELIDYCSRWTVAEDQVDDKYIEMINTAIYWTATAQNPHKQLKFDFFFIHAVNLCIVMKSILDLPILSAANRARLLEMKGRVDLLIWASRKMPTPQDTDVHTYPIRLGWPEVFERSYNHPTDDGHLAKFVRTLAYAQELCVPYEGEAKQRGLKVTGDMWLKIGNMAVDTAGKKFEDIWVRGAGFDEPWDKFDRRN
ncbi:hypothetical protein GT037_010064 [Alternaria burnsii]|uniref:HypA-like protein n=1 Tax=Alternaria burnsii TaxID=1187904 RepID=A0A8H7EDF7_9PLEO|nr:uncharacterized protein GT037_010064 [Alternaria burnsii]KAF7671841.1 hypothetical protein GT037_010064 [Alternaria burnsii]CAI9630963.1 unnamed protein product [Alternaria burnsii]